MAAATSTYSNDTTPFRSACKRFHVVEKNSRIADISGCFETRPREQFDSMKGESAGGARFGVPPSLDHGLTLAAIELIPLLSAAEIAPVPAALPKARTTAPTMAAATITYSNDTTPAWSLRSNF